MAISLVKGQNTELSAALVNVDVGLGWEPRVGSGDAFDLDASAFLLDSSRKVRSDADFIFYNQLESTCGSVQHMGDNLDGSSEDGSVGGDKEVVRVNLPLVPQDVERVVFVVSIYQADERRQNFGMVEDAYIRIVDADRNVEVARFDLSEDACVNQTVVFGELYRRGGVWKFRALGQGFDCGLGEIARSYGVDVEM